MNIFAKTAGIFATGLLSAVIGLSPALASDKDVGFDLSPEQKERPHTSRNAEAIAAIPADLKLISPGKLTVATAPFGPPIVTYATDTTTVVGADADIASAVAEALGLQLELVAVAWPDWPLGLTSGKYDAVISNVGVTEQRKEKFDFSTYRQGLHGFFVKADSNIGPIKEPKDAAGLRIIVGSGTNQERILLEWSKQNEAAGLKPLDLQYFDDEATRLIALRSGRADVIVQPHATLVFIAARDKDIKRVGTLAAGWPNRSDAAVTTRKDSGLANAVTIAINGLINDGTYKKILDRWQLAEEALPKSETNPPGLPKN